jgi:hypothetical protein
MQESVYFNSQVRGFDYYNNWGNVSFCYVLLLFCGEGLRSRCYGRTAVLRLIVQPCDEDEEKDDWFFPLFRVMEHRWNEIYSGKPKYSAKYLSQCHFVHHKSYID